MYLRGVTRVELLVVGIICVFVLLIDISVIWYVNRKAADIQTLSDVQQIRAALEVYISHNNYYPESTEMIELNNAYASTQKLCTDGFKQFNAPCDKTIMRVIPNTNYGNGNRYFYQAVAESKDYNIQFTLQTNFRGQGLIQGTQCATSSGISSQSCF